MLAQLFIAQKSLEEIESFGISYIIRKYRYIRNTARLIIVTDPEQLKEGVFVRFIAVHGIIFIII